MELSVPEPSLDAWLFAGPPPPSPIEQVCEQAGIYDFFAQQKIKAWLRGEIARRRLELAEDQADLHAMEDQAHARLTTRLERLVENGDRPPESPISPQTSSEAVVARPSPDRSPSSPSLAND